MEDTDSSEDIPQSGSRFEGYSPAMIQAMCNQFPAGGRRSDANTPSFMQSPLPQGIYQQDMNNPYSNTYRLKAPAPVDSEPYFSWVNDEMAPLSKDQIRNVFLSIQQMFGFQKSSMENMYEHLMVQLDSRASRMSAPMALITLHADYIGGENSNYRKWYFCCMQNDDSDIFNNIDIDEIKSRLRGINDDGDKAIYPETKIEVAELRWRERMRQYSPTAMVKQLALYLLIWGESNNIRFAPECLCFIFKCSLDFMEYGDPSLGHPPEFTFLHKVIDPLYNFYRDQQFKEVDGSYIRREKDHQAIIGYDDINQLFWYKEGLDRLNVGKDKIPLLSFKKEDRFQQLSDVNWNTAFYKTYKEKRTWLHLITNFSRVWIIHLSTFWYCSSFNSPTLYTAHYQQRLNNQPKLEAMLSVVSLGSTVACIIELVATIGEAIFVPRKWPGRKHLFSRLCLLFLLTVINFVPSVFVLFIVPLNAKSNLGLGLSIAQFCVSLFTTILLSFRPLAEVFGGYSLKASVQYDPVKVFTSSYPKLDPSNRMLSIFLWILVFSAKFIESYFFLTLSLRDPIRNLHIMDLSRCHGDALFGNIFCQYQADITLGLMYLADVILFFLDTYLWYIIWNCIISLSLSFSSGISILSPWRNIFTKLPLRIHSKLLSTNNMEIKYQPDLLISQIWNAIIISMYREHLLSADHVHRLIYDRLPNEETGKMALRTPSFFLIQDDGSQRMSDFFVRNSEAERRISFFAQSLSTAMPEAIPVEAMPTFTVLIPHYGEKILLGLREIIMEDPHSKMSMLEYLKEMFPHEWNYFVRDTKILSCDEDLDENTKFETEDEYMENKINDIPYFCIGFKSATPTYQLRTRIWASLRTQTLYRTVSGFMNYKRAIMLMHRVENPEMLEYFGGSENAEEYLDTVACRKFKMVVAMQRLQKFTPAEKDDLKVLIRSFPDIRISCLEEKLSTNGEKQYFAILYDITDDVDGNNLNELYRIQLSGNPILGDGKSDNQNNSIIFYRGEYIQVIDANQDNYLEECLKIRSVLAEFESFDTDEISPYVHPVGHSERDPVAFLGAREYIFSQYTGVLGDVAASKEQTFGTMFARTLAQIGAKLHYGHPDFINAIFMTTRGGISKAQKGLHLNEDIYAGINAICRGGRIKHCDYFQCGKGRDLGFGSILNFTTKIGSGMGEQMLSREYFYLGTEMPLDRFLSFYYAHPGFHLNNLFILLSLEMFILVSFNLGTLKHELIMCAYDKTAPITDLQIPIGCQNLQPVLDWVTRYVLSIFICFFISFLPLILHELSENGPWKAITRLLMHFSSLSPVFEVFVCQIYATSLKNDIIFGGAQYISTGRGFSITRIPFVKLYSSYATTCIYPGIRLFLVLLFSVVTMWQPAILWFWITFISLCFSPFLFNPHEFSATEFLLDYRQFILWLTRTRAICSDGSWINFIKINRSKITGFKRHLAGQLHRPTKQIVTANFSKPPFINVLAYDVGLPLVEAIIMTFAYMFINAQSGVDKYIESNSLIRLLIVSIAPFVLNAIILVCIFPLSCLAVPILQICCKRVPQTLAGVAHCGGIVTHVIIFETIWILEGFDIGRSLCCFTASIYIQRFLVEAGKVLTLTREMREDYGNMAWWSGKWMKQKVSWKYIFTQPFREFWVKITEMSLFAVDFIIGHVIHFSLTPLLFIPYIDHWHSCFLMWVSPSKKLRGPIHTTSQRRRRRRRAIQYGILYILIMIFFIIALAAPFLARKYLGRDLSRIIPDKNFGMIQPSHQNNNDTGPHGPKSILRGKPKATKFDRYWI